jgi:hypothetical protein
MCTSGFFNKWLGFRNTLERETRARAHTRIRTHVMLQTLYRNTPNTKHELQKNVSYFQKHVILVIRKVLIQGF